MAEVRAELHYHGLSEHTSDLLPAVFVLDPEGACACACVCAYMCARI